GLILLGTLLAWPPLWLTCGLLRNFWWSPVVRTRFKTLIYLKGFGGGACGGHGSNKQIFGAVPQVHIPNSELWDDCGTPFRGDATPIRWRYELDGSLCNANVSSTGLINSLFVALTKQLNA